VTTQRTTQRTRTFEWDDPSIFADAAQRMSGLEFLRAIVAGTLLEPTEWQYNPIGVVHGGVAATLLDSAMGCAVQSTLTAGVGYTTTDLQVRYVRAMGTDTGPVRAEGTVVHAGRRLVTAQGQIIAKNSGKLIAHATTACMVLS
jgi:uncharacterized protein (TIGR00369 family)